jgi:hypothetical protein
LPGFSIARGDKPNKHDILTGSQPDGTACPASTNLTCQNWGAGNSGNLAGAAQSAIMTARGIRRPACHGTRRTARAVAARKT